MLAMILKFSPAASITSPSIVSVAVERTPDAPLTASSSSSRSGGRSCRTLTSKDSRDAEPGLGDPTGNQNLLGHRLLHMRALLFEHLSQDGLQDAAVAEVLHLDR